MSVDVLIRWAFHAAGGLSFVRFRNAASNRILTYHSFDPASLDGLDKQCEHLRRYYNPVSLDAVAGFVREGASVPRNSVAVTVDDGYRDFYVHAYPIFRRHGIPVTVFLMTGFLDHEVRPWWDQLKYAFLNSPLDKVIVPIGSGAEQQLSLTDEASRRNAAGVTGELLKALSNAERLAFLDDLPRLLEVEIPETLPWEPMSWDEVRELASQGVTFGAHTRSHPILASLKGEDEIRAEIESSRNRIAQELGAPPEHFSYPNGLAGDIDDRVRRIAGDGGFRTAVSAIPGLNRPMEDPFMLKRLSMDPELPLPYFSRRLAGFRL
jgi:peptidoglycan/xylan/chitin deacetylase (PgdA/CDA1 family)